MSTTPIRYEDKLKNRTLLEWGEGEEGADGTTRNTIPARGGGHHPDADRT